MLHYDTGCVKRKLTMKKETIIELIGLALEKTENTKPKESLGQNIVVLDRGFVYVGEVTDEGESIRITNAKNIRVWGTTEGLGQLRNGPLSSTELDVVGEVIAPKHSVIHYIKCSGF
jgi:hypothetical protein